MNSGPGPVGVPCLESEPGELGHQVQFRRPGRGVEVIEVFPTASWTRWQGKRGPWTRAAWTRQGLAAFGLELVPARTNQD